MRGETDDHTHTHCSLVGLLGTRKMINTCTKHAMLDGPLKNITIKQKGRITERREAGTDLRPTVCNRRHKHYSSGLAYHQVSSGSRGFSQHQNEFLVPTSCRCSVVHAVNWFSLYV